MAAIDPLRSLGRPITPCTWQAALTMAVPVLADMVRKAGHGEPLPLAVFGGYIVLGVLLYAFYHAA